MTRVIEPTAAFLARLEKSSDQHKYDHGHALVLSGGVGRGGAARLAARAALRIGAGLVTVGCPPAALIENAARLDAVMLRAVKDASALSEILSDTRINALCLGPGLGLGPRTLALVDAALSADVPRAIVLDADALTMIAQESALRAKLHANCVLTPHAGEFVRLFPKLDPSAPEVAVKDAAKQLGCVVLLKGAKTYIADTNGACSLNDASGARAAPWLATAGSGDVLAGLITGLLARGLAPMQAAEAGAWLHVEAARAFGPGLIAEDLPDIIPQVLRQVRS